MKYLPRNDFVVVELKLRTQIQKLHVPEQSDEAKEWIVRAVGPDVKDDGMLRPGAVVQITGTVGEDIARLPREKGLFVTKQANIVLVEIDEVHERIVKQ